MVELKIVSGGAPTQIKKYANRRLYNTQTSTYVTLDTLAQMVKDGTEFQVTDVKTGEDITRAVLTQIIFEEESKGHHLLPVSFLRHVITYYGDVLQEVVPGYLEQVMLSFARNQEQIRQYMHDAMGGHAPSIGFEETARRNMEGFLSAIQKAIPEHGEDIASPGNPSDATQGQVDELRGRLDAMQRQLEELTKQLKKS